ncbi:hypothetical protein AURANDRAFT_64659 [Aureococcus anophagefferens]|uniref:Uncharacterized protein n=1 Tax=Aureococcus anophagefferens TaxID=44056 RepID=F0YB50_AURAN|nr:hypothetical protein AURANDRAFT_64659 [Aureococcus anophagefferens]EGB07566.1 hypothetical protein AURANDRAFT_64659 [Aureococcus anophagefferens]|eukprot:XP_009037567.1 hypothetical protein AURANDRAFT_64659 [Aureococcus anophagefferens]
MGAGASSREAALSSPEKEPAKCRQPKLQSISFRRCDLHASSGGTYHHRGASEVAAGAASPLAADEAEAAGDDEDPAARLDRRAVEAWAADAVLLGAAGRSLTRLDLSEGCVSDRVAVGLADAARARPERVASLTDLDLSGGSSFAEGGCVGFRGCLALADVLPKALASLTALRVSGHHVGARGAAALAAALRKHPCLARLDAQRCFLGDAGVEALCGAGRSLVALDLSHNYFNRAGWRAIAALLETSTRLRSLALRDALADPAAGSLIQRECRPGGALTAADVIDAAVALAGGLAGNRALTRLDLGASFDREAVAAMGRIPVGEDLGVEHVARALAAHPALEALALGVDRRDARSVAALQQLALARATPDLPAFRFAFPLGLPEAEFVAGATANAEGAVYGAEIARTCRAAAETVVHRAPWLEKFRQDLYEPLADALAASRRRADDVKYGRREEAWNNVFFNEDDADDGADAKPRRSLRAQADDFAKAARARVEDAVDRYTDRRRASAVAEARDAQPTDYYGNGGYWRALRVDCRVGPSGATALARGLLRAPRDLPLRSLRLSGDVGPKGAARLAAALLDRDRGTLADLDLSRNGLRDAGLASLAEALAAQARLASLDLSGNRLKGPGLAAACDALAAAPAAARLRELRLRDTPDLGADGAAAVGRLLASPRAAAAPALDLGGAARLRPKVLDAALAPLAALDRLGLDACGLDAAGGAVLGRRLPPTRRLVVDGNPRRAALGRDGVVGLAAALGKIVELDACDVDADGAALAAVADGVVRGGSLTGLRVGPVDRADDATARTLERLFAAPRLRFLDLCGESLGAEGALGAISRDARRATADADWNALDEGRGRQHTGRVPPRRDASREAVLGADDAFDLEDNARARPRSPEIVADNPLASLV